MSIAAHDNSISNWNDRESTIMDRVWAFCRLSPVSRILDLGSWFRKSTLLVLQWRSDRRLGIRFSVSVSVSVCFSASACVWGPVGPEAVDSNRDIAYQHYRYRRYLASGGPHPPP